VATRGRAISSAVRNWLETSPRTGIGASSFSAGARADAQRRIAFVAEVVDAAAELAQRVDQVADGPFVHARHAAQFEVAAQQASAAVSGRIAVPALPRNSLALNGPAARAR
jgi:hypothetical protein